MTQRRGGAGWGGEEGRAAAVAGHCVLLCAVTTQARAVGQPSWRAGGQCALVTDVRPGSVDSGDITMER